MTDEMLKHSRNLALDLRRKSLFRYDNIILQPFISPLKKTFNNSKFYQALQIQIHCLSKTQSGKK